VTLSLWWLVVRWAIGWGLFSLPGLPHDNDVAEPSDSRVSVIIPARNEAHNLPELLTALHAQRQQADEIIVVDDHSSDDTAAVARANGATVVPAADLPPEWTGKSWALWQGVAQSTGDVLVFLDADVRPAPHFLSLLLAERAHIGGLVSVQPYHQMVRAYERLAALFNLLGVLGGGLGRDAKHRAVGFGPAMVTSRHDYLEVGGHESVRAAVLEDAALAQRYSDSGKSSEAFIGRRDISYRMYPNGVGGIVEGFAKNFATGAGGLPLPRLVWLIVWVSGLISASMTITVDLVRWAFGGAHPSLVTVAVFVAFAIQLALLLRPVGNFGATALFMPVIVAFFLFVFLFSLYGYARGYVTWKGRRIQVRSSSRTRATTKPAP
jgi:4,4'-diaponeurosporenoate glycosyltransferase